MDNKEFINTNRDGWNTLVNNNNPFSNTSLPEYGPYMRNESELHLFDGVEGKRVLELGCGSGASMKYLKRLGASEVWGIDISEAQIKKIDDSDLDKSKIFISPMEYNPGIKEEYFDYVLSLFSIGFSSDPLKVLKLISSYLKKDGKFILSWTHPLFDRLSVEDDKVTLSKSYNDESPRELYKGQDKIKLMQYNLKVSTLVNGLIDAGMVLDRIIEEEPIMQNEIGDYKSTYFDERKLSASPTTLILIAHKK